VSIEVIHWALNVAPIPRDRRDASSLTVVLVGLANHADPDGRNAFPSLARLVRYTRLSERSVRYALRALAELDLIRPTTHTWTNTPQSNTEPASSASAIASYAKLRQWEDAR
jgi:hypothetical protein